MAAPDFAFVDLVAQARYLRVTRTGEHACRVEPRQAAGWFCDLDDGTPTGESDPASSVRWVCPALRLAGAPQDSELPLLEVRRAGPLSDLDRALAGVLRLVGRAWGRAPGPVAEDRLVYTDPDGILDPDLRRRVENWPAARHGDGVVRPAETWSIARTGEGLVVLSVSWWASAPALDHQIGLGLDIARQLAARA